MQNLDLIRKTFIGVVIFLGCTFANIAAAADRPELAAFKQAIRTKYDMKEKAFDARDGETIVTKFYAEDVVSAGEGSPLHRGREELRKLYQMPEVIENDVKIVSFHTHVNGDAGWDWADFHVTPADAKVAPFTFKILFLWEKQNGEWWCKGDMYVVDKSADVPATANASAP